MTQNEKDILLKDLYGRLSYGVRCEVIKRMVGGEMVYMRSGSSALELTVNNVKEIVTNSMYEIKPYLFPLSSMTEEQKEELITITNGKFRYMWDDITNAIPRKNTGEWGVSENAFIDGINVINILYIWLLKNHFDIYGLIPIGLAIDATNLKVY